MDADEHGCEGCFYLWFSGCHLKLTWLGFVEIEFGQIEWGDFED